LDNLLVVEPRPRNPLLADAVKRVGLAERTGRGVDLIYEGMLRYGRPAPDYSSSNSTTVAVRLSSTAADIPFLRMILEEEGRVGVRIPLQSLILLARLREERRLDVARATVAIQKNEAVARGVLERLVESGLVEAHGATKGRSYTLSSAVYQRMGQSADYVRQAGFDRIQQEQMVIKLVKAKGTIKRRDVIELCKISPHQASFLLAELTRRGILQRIGKGKGTVYEPSPNIRPRA
jgi:ATP-dependent DNA helicase RecG